MWTVIQAEFKKTARTSRRYLPIILPVLFSLLLMLYLVSSQAHEQLVSHAVGVASIFGELLNLGVLIMSAIFIGLTIENDYHATKLSWLLGAVSPVRMIFGQWFFFIGQLAWVLLLSGGVFIGVGYGLIGLPSAWVFLLLKMLGLLFLATINTLLLYYLCALFFGFIPTVCLGIFGLITAAVLGNTGLGTGVWPYIPFTWGARGIDALASGSLDSHLALFLSVTSLFVSGLIVWIVRFFYEGRKCPR